MFLNSNTSLSMYLFCNSRIHVITLYSGHVCVYYASMLRCWYLVWILIMTDHPWLGVGCHRWWWWWWWLLLVHCVINLFGWGQIRGLTLLLAYFFSWTLGILDNLISCDLYLFCDTCNIATSYGFAHSLVPSLCNLLFSGDNLFWCWRLCACSLAARAQSFLPIFRSPATVWVNVVDFLGLYCSSLQKCNTSDLLNLWKLSYNSSSVLRRSLTKWLCNCLTHNGSASWEDEGMRSTAAVLVTKASVWGNCCSIGRLGPLASTPAAWDSVEVCGW
jgi:hypothetical protein